MTKLIKLVPLLLATLSACGDLPEIKPVCGGDYQDHCFNKHSFDPAICRVEQNALFTHPVLRCDAGHGLPDLEVENAKAVGE